MMNYAVLVGRLVNDMKISKENTLKIVLAVPRSYRNTNGDYTTDFINCRLYGSLATNTVEYCKKGDLVAVKGSIEVEDNVTFIRTEKISFLAPNKSKDE